MWNPLHFAVYYQNFEIVKYLVKELKVNISLSVPKANAESEKDATNTEKYPEDKIMALLLAYDRRDAQILKFLLDECY
jgi:ankyrin repeat protein